MTCRWHEDVVLITCGWHVDDMWMLSAWCADDVGMSYVIRQWQQLCIKPTGFLVLHSLHILLKATRSPQPGLYLLLPNPLHPILSSCYRPPTKLQEGNVFSRVCLFRRGISDTPSVQGPSARPRPHSSSDMFKIVHYEALSLVKRAVGILLKDLLVSFFFTGSNCSESYLHPPCNGRVPPGPASDAPASNYNPFYPFV